ncbi:DUF1648 domain-containing protein [Anaeromicropila herbilytica]|uniref:DUF1648 domain-containing protein n=1 Tax=Anaeromicropila herbilytica TaxID=2785025 RepID=A0A7R7ICM0_9FIRM|nr:DUF1648 domain-containing protein [Anaeromicropila herbilytica]BCN30667.1 hypothetical protein bsdtb5_19620 [Anaeromicropila herbilytica]
MKSKVHLLYYGLMFLPLVLVIISFIFLPDRIPVHYNINGEINRWGSKLEMLIFPVMTIFIGTFLKTVAKTVVRKNDDNSSVSNEKVSNIISIATLLVFNVMTILFIYDAFYSIADHNKTIRINTSQIMFIVLGIAIIILGNVMPKCRMNSYIGLRTTWSMSNELVWMKSQRLGGIVFVISGILTIISNLIFSGSYAFVYTISIIIIDVIVSIVGSYYLYKKYYTEKI